jgi:glutamyl/glutaminyl-tRNA synthetase
MGYIPEAMVNFLALLGWSPGGDREVMLRQELIALFDLQGISGGAAVFNPEKLDWFNGQHLMRLAPAELVERVKPLLEAARLWAPQLDTTKRQWLEQVLALVTPRVRRLPDFVELAKPFLAENIDYDADAVSKHLAGPDIAGHVSALAERLAGVSPFDEAGIEAALRAVADARGIKAGVLIHAARVAATGKSVSPGIFDVLALLGKEKTLARLKRFS